MGRCSDRGRAETDDREVWKLKIGTDSRILRRLSFFGPFDVLDSSFPAPFFIDRHSAKKMVERSTSIGRCPWCLRFRTVHS